MRRPGVFHWIPRRSTAAPHSNRLPTGTGLPSSMEREGTLADLFERLDRERQAADRQYNDALTRLDRALQARQDHQTHQVLPSPPVFHDASQVERLNRGWKIVPEGAPAVDRSLKGRLRGF